MMILTYNVLVKLMKKAIILVICFSLLMTVLTGMIYVKITPSIQTIGQMEIERLNQMIITHCYFTDESQYDRLVIIERGEDNEIKLIDFDMVRLNQIANAIVLDIESTYNQLEEGTYQAIDDTYYERRLEQISQNGVISSIPIVTLFHLSALSFFSPCISVRYKHLSSVGSSIQKDVQNYGMNHVMIELSIEIKMTMVMVYPFYEQYHTQIIKIPVLLDIFEGQIPLIYSKKEE